MREYFFAVPLMFFFIPHLFYLSSHIALTGIFFVIFDHLLRYSFLVPDSCWETIINSNSIYAYKLIRADFTENIIKHDKNDACFFSFYTILQLFWGFWYNTIDTIYVHIVGKYIIHFQSLWNRSDKLV
jgi:hypothetical protein